MVTLFIVVGLYIVECFGSSCYSIDRMSLDVLLAAGMAELIYEIPAISLRIYRGRDKDDDKS